MGFWGLGCCCGGNVTFTVNGCGAIANVGATVTVIQGGVTIATGTTNSLGKYIPALGITGAITYTVAQSGYATSSGGTTVSGTASIGVSLTVAATLHATDGSFTATLTTVGSTRKGTLSVSTSSGPGTTGDCGGVPTCMGTGPASIPITLTFTPCTTLNAATFAWFCNCDNSVPVWMTSNDGISSHNISINATLVSVSNGALVVVYSINWNPGPVTRPPLTGSTITISA